jgi:hypothetical protein
MRRAPQDRHRAPAQRLGGNGSDVAQLRKVVKRGQAVGSHDPVELSLRLGDKLRAELDAREDKAGESAGRLQRGIKSLVPISADERGGSRRLSRFSKSTHSFHARAKR